MAKRAVHFSSVHIWSDTRILVKECQTLSEAGYETHLVCAKGENPKHAGVHFHLIENYKGSKLWRMFFVTAKVYRTAMNLKGDVYQFHDTELLPWALLMKWRGKKVLYDVHENVPGDIMSKQYLPRFVRSAVAACAGMLQLLVAKRLSGVICATDYIAQRFRLTCPKCIVVNNYPRLNELSGNNMVPAARENAVIYVGDITYSRGIIEMLDALALLPGVVLHLAGKMSDAGIEEKLKTHKAWPQVVYHGFIDRKKFAALASVCKAGMVTILPVPNHIHSQPNKLFEYMSASLPVIASDFEVWQPLVVDEGIGFCVNPGDADAIVACINQLMTNDELVKQLGTKARKLIEEKYQWDREAEKMLRFYDEIISE